MGHMGHVVNRRRPIAEKGKQGMNKFFCKQLLYLPSLVPPFLLWCSRRFIGNKYGIQLPNVDHCNEILTQQQQHGDLLSAFLFFPPSSVTFLQYVLYFHRCQVNCLLLAILSFDCHEKQTSRIQSDVLSEKKVFVPKTQSVESSFLFCCCFF